MSATAPQERPGGALGGSWRHVEKLEVRRPQDFPGPVVVKVSFAQPFAIHEAASLLAAALWPHDVSCRWGSSRFAVAPDTPSAVLALLPGGQALPERPEPRPKVLAGEDVLLHRAGDVIEERPGTLALPVSTAGLVVDGLDQRPMLDLRVHRPLGREDSVVASEGVDVRLTLRDDRLELYAADSTAVWSAPEGVPLSEDAVRTLRTIRCIDVGPAGPGLGPGGQARLAEIAAAGPVLHGARPTDGHVDGFDASLAGLLEREAPPRGTTTVLRSVEQRRAALLAYGGVLGLDRALRSRGRGTVMPSVTAVLVSRRPGNVLSTLRLLAAQTYPELEVVIAMHGVAAPDLDSLDLAQREAVSSVLTVDADVPFGEVLARASARAQGDLIAKIDDDDIYGRDHVTDLVLAYLYSGADVVGKQPEFTYLKHRDVTVRRTFATESFVPAVAGGTMMLSTGALHAAGGWRPVPRSVDRALLERVREAGGSVYATHSPGFVYVRHQEGHTWKVQDKRYLGAAVERWQGLNAELLGERPSGTP